MTAPTTDFPIAPELEGYFWQWDRLHCPRTLTPLEHELLLESTGEGFTKAIQEMGSSIRAVCRLINYYNYLAGMPMEDLGGETPEQRRARYEKSVAEFMPKVGEKWQKEWLPSILPRLAEGRKADYTKMSDAELLAEFERMRQDVVYRWYIHGLILYSFVAANLFSEFYAQTFGTDQKEGYEALGGFPSMALESSRGLWRLSRIARADPGLRQLFETADTSDAAALLAKLNESEAGRNFVKELNTFLEDFGWRADSVYELTRPSWREDPHIPLGAIQGYIAIDDDGGPEAQYQEAVRRREQLLAEARRKLANDPEKLKKFNELYAAAESFTPVVEDHNHWIDQMGDILMRYPCLELGRRLVAKGSIAARDDVFMLRTSEIKEALASGKDFKDVVAQRRAEMEHFAKIVPPPVIGTPVMFDDPVVERVLIPFFGTPVEPSSDPSVINGIAASPGTVRGTAKVVRSLSEASKLQKGDIMVCEMTLPPWTPLFATVSAVVADTGGVLSHCAIVAREYRIPCVVGTMMGTSLIQDGQTVTVDGTRGIVRIEK